MEYVLSGCEHTPSRVAPQVICRYPVPAIISLIAGAFCFVKLFKTNNIKYVYLAALATGFSISCKMEFYTCLIFLVIGLILYKRLKFVQYCKICQIIS